MRYYFYTEKDKHGRHEVHTEQCNYLPNVNNRKYIGDYYNCSSAINDAMRMWPSLSFDGCYWCCNECHKG